MDTHSKGMVTAVRRGTVSLKHNEMDYFSFGFGDAPMVILPGLSLKSVMQSAEGVASAYRLFAQEYTVYCFDRTKFLSEKITVEQLAEDTAEAMKSLGIRSACVFGASQGGMMALYLAVNHPELVGRLVLGSTCARLNPTAEAVMARWVAAARRGDIDAFCDVFLDVLYGKAFAEQFGAFIRLAHRDVTEADFRRFILLGDSCRGLNVYERLGEIRCPVLVLGAEDDRVLTSQASVEIAEKLGCPIYLYGGEYGHCVFDEAPDYKQRMYHFFKESHQ